MSSNSDEELFQLARAGDSQALGDLLEQYREMLRGKAQQELSSRLQVRADASDIVQTTFLDAYRDLKNFQGTEIPQFLAWVQQILRNNILQSVEMHKLAQKRTINREKPLDGSTDSRQARRENLTADQSTPSQRAQRAEHAEHLIRILTLLPEQQHAAVRMRFLEEMSLEEIASSMQKTKTAVAGLLKRGMQTLRRSLSKEFHEEMS